MMQTKYGSNINPFATKLTAKEYAEWRAALAKRANTRLRALEKSASKITGEKYTYGAYKKYAQDVLNMDIPRFSESKKPGNINVMKSEIRQLNQFLNAKSSTIAGNRDIERLRIETFEKGEWGRKKFDAEGNPLPKNRKKIKFASNKEFYDFLTSGILSKKINPYIDSEKMIELYESAREKGIMHDEIIDRMFDAFTEFKNNTAPKSLEYISNKLGLSWLDL